MFLKNTDNYKNGGKRRKRVNKKDEIKIHNKINKTENEIAKTQEHISILTQKMTSVELARAISYSNKVRRLNLLYERLNGYLNILEKMSE